MSCQWKFSLYNECMLRRLGVDSPPLGGPIPSGRTLKGRKFSKKFAGPCGNSPAQTIGSAPRPAGPVLRRSKDKLANAAVPLIQVKDLRKSYEDDVPILKGISIDIEEGDLVSIIGPSGCGKSTFLRCLNCLEYIDSGSVTIAGVTVSRSREDEENDRELDKKFLASCHRMRQEVGMVFQSFNLFPHKTVLENIMLAPMVVKHMTEEAAKKRGLELLEKVGLTSFASKYPATMSGGQTQRAAIARALAMQPKVMLYDEPTSALDPELVGEVLQVMKDLDREGMTQVVVTHQMTFARDASDYILFMCDGEIVEKESGDTLFTHPKDPRTQNFLRHLKGVVD